MLLLVVAVAAVVPVAVKHVVHFLALFLRRLTSYSLVQEQPHVRTAQDFDRCANFAREQN